MQMTALLSGLILSLAAHAAVTTRAPLTGQHTHGFYQGSPLLICEYKGPRWRFEILAENGACAPYIVVQ